VLQSRENDSGGFGLWSSSPQTAEFPTVYAAHFLVEAHDRGQKFPPEMLASLNDWLTHFASTPAPTLEDGRLRAYAVYLLAHQGIKPAAALSNVEQELANRHAATWFNDLAAAYLASTYRLMQRNSDADRIIRNVPWSQQKREGMDDVYYDPVVHDAQLLYLLARHFPDRVSLVPPAVLEGIGSAISGNRVSSLSAAYTLLALDAYAKAAAPKVKLGIVLGGQRQAMTSKVNVPAGLANVQFTNDGSLTAYYSLNESGFDRNPLTAEINQGLEVIHEFLDANGNVTTKVTVGEEFWVRLRLRTTNRDHLYQIAVVDLLPGGVEPTLDREAGPGSNWTPQYVDRRDDRVVLYGDATKDAATYVYKVRATNAGVFQSPPAFAEGMYNRQVSGMSQAAKLEIVKP
jgi:alpha-2-macroglobulin